MAECAWRSGLSCMSKESGEDSVTSCFHARGNSGLLSVEELRRVCVGGGGRCSCWDVRDFCVPEAISASPLRQCWFGVEATRHSAIFAGNASRDLSGLVPKKARLSNCLVTSIGVACGCWQVRQTDEKWPISSNHPRISVKNCKKRGWLHVKPESTHVRVFPAVPGCMPIPAECRGKRCQAGRARQAGQAGQAGQVRQAGKVGKARQAGSSAKRDRREFREGLSPQKACLSLPFRQNRWSRIALPDLEVGQSFRAPHQVSSVP